MGPIKISITTTQLEGASEYGGDVPEKSLSADKHSSSEDKENPVKDSSNDSQTKENIDQTKSEEQGNSVSGAGGTIDENCYRYEGEDCFFTEPASGVTYLWDKEKSQWVNKETGVAQPATAADQGEVQKEHQNYKMEGGTYVYVDKLTNQKHKWNLETNQWDKVENDALQDDGDESEEDENATEEEKKARQYRKRKAAPGI